VASGYSASTQINREPMPPRIYLLTLKFWASRWVT
jgi:hypothetical protein